jgi:hypothetical protein
MRHCRRRPLRPRHPTRVFVVLEHLTANKIPARSGTVEAANFTFSRGWTIITLLEFFPTIHGLSGQPVFFEFSILCLSQPVFRL